jgi:RimJ/RimL family protein N-acetyltransferase
VNLAEAVLETERLLLYPMLPEHADVLAGVYCDPDAMRYYPRPYSRKEVAERIESSRAAYAREGHGLYTVVLKATGEVMGDCGPTIQEVEGTPEIEIGYHFLPRFWGHGYATEAARAARDWVFRHLACERVISLVRPVNVPSQRVAARNGMSIAKRVVFRGLEHDVWAITRAEWQARETAVGQSVSKPE